MTPRIGLRPALLAAAAILAGCANRPAPLYMWEGFPRQQYDVLRHDGASIPEQIQALEAHAEKARGAHAALPPGFRAHLGMLKLSVGDVDGGRELLGAEKAAFPESAPYMDQLLKRFEQPPVNKADKAAAEANPA